MRIVIEPGHDGVYDPGAVVEGVREADIVREVARRIATLSGDGLSYELKRRPPRAGGLAVLRAALARNPPDVIISLHCDSSEQDPRRHVARVYYWPKLDGSVGLAETIVNAAVGDPWGSGEAHPCMKDGVRRSMRSTCPAE